MSPQLFDLSAHIYSYIFAGVTVLLVFKLVSKPSKLDAIPAFGSSSWMGPWWASFEYLTNGTDLIQKGYEKHKSSPFKVAAFYRWLVVVNSREHVEELQRAPADTLSVMEALNDRHQLDYTVGFEISRNPYHVPIIRWRLTRNLDTVYPEMWDEITTGFEDVLNLRGNEWATVPVLSSVQQVVCRTSNRVFVGFPLCRDPDWINLNIQYTVDIGKGSIIIALFPDLLKPAATWLFTNINQKRQRARKLLSPVIEKRRKHLSEFGREWSDKPNDFLSWLMEEAEGPELTVPHLTSRMLFMNVGAIHTSSTSFTHALFYLAANPQYIQPLREEVEGIVKNGGWTKAALAKMRKVDSFLRECQRLEGHNYVSLQRKALKDFTFADGVFVPKGTMISTAARCVHYNEAFYKDASAFEPFRFAHLTEVDDEGSKHQFVSTSAEYLPFGHGRQACPGRFFAATELKTMLAHVVVTYDVKLEDGARRPQALHLVTANLPDPDAKVMFRRRVD